MRLPKKKTSTPHKRSFCVFYPIGENDFVYVDEEYNIS